MLLGQKKNGRSNARFGPHHFIHQPSLSFSFFFLFLIIAIDNVLEFIYLIYHLLLPWFSSHELLASFST